MRVCLELRHDVHPDEWSARHQRGEVPDRWPYGLDRLANYGVQPEFRRPLRSRVPMRAARALSAKGGGFEWLEGSATAFAPERGRADAVVCWDEYNGVPAVIRERALRGVDRVVNVFPRGKWKASDDVAIVSRVDVFKHLARLARDPLAVDVVVISLNCGACSIARRQFAAGFGDCLFCLSHKFIDT